MINHKIKLDKEFEYLLEKWSFCDNGAGYAVACINGKKTYLHQLIIGKREGMVIDHINGDKLDNRNSNLRHISQRENTLNTKLSKNNTSGHKGVIFDKRIKKWCARISPFGKSIHLGSFTDIKDALMARHQAEIVYAWNKANKK